MEAVGNTPFQSGMMCHLSLEYADFSLAAKSTRRNYFLRAVSTPPPFHVVLCISGRAFRRFLRVRFQTGIQHQGFWTQHSWSWRHDGSDGLPVSG